MRAEWCNQSVAVQLEGTARLPRLLAGLGTGGIVVVVLPLKYFTTVYLVHCPKVWYRLEETSDVTTQSLFHVWWEQAKVSTWYRRSPTNHTF